MFWLNFLSPYSQQTTQMISLHWHHWRDDTNCDEAVECDSLATAHMLGKNFAEVKLKRNDKVKSLSSVNKCFNIRDHVIPVNPKQLFNRMICIATTTSKLKECLCYELSPYPTSLSDEISQRKTAKSQLMTVLAKYSEPTSIVAADTYFVIDGGQLLHKVVWQQPASKKCRYIWSILFIHSPALP